MHGWIWWFVAALVMAGVEVVTVDLFFIMAAGGAAAAGLAALLGADLLLQCVVFAVVSILLLGVVRPLAIKRFRPPATPTNVDALLGAEAYVLEQVDGRDGRVKVGGEVWSARSSDESVVHEPGAKVRVVKVAGATVLVS